MSNYPKARSILYRIPPPLWLAASVAMVWLIQRFLPQGNIIPDGLRVLGFFQIGLGMLLAFDVAFRFFRAKTPVHPFEQAKELVTDGMLRFSRNPIYLGLALILFGCALLWGTVIGLLVLPLFIWALTTFVIVDEEAMLEAEFGEAYRDYKSRVRRWL
jgi:protein-S-isoprenylcysteine O-methyltransferase Ste14